MNNLKKALPITTDKYKFCNHHHELTDQHEIINLGTGDFVANKKAIPLLKALNELGLITRSHHITDGCEYGFVCLLLENDLSIEVRSLDHTNPISEKQLIISWRIKNDC